MEKEDNQTQHHNKILLSWLSPEFIPHKKSARWFLIAGVITLMLIVYALYTDSATMAIVFIVLAGVYYLTHNQEPKIIEIKITELGIFIDQTFYQYNMINSFWIIYRPPFVRTLNIRLGNKSLTRIAIQLDSQDPVSVRKALGNEIPEIEGQDEGFADMLIRLLRL